MSSAFQPCTVITRNHLAHAHVLADSLARHHPRMRLFAVLADDRHGLASSTSENLELLDATEIGVDAAELRRMAAMYEPAGLVSSLRGWALEAMLDRRTGAALHLDADMLVLAPLDEAAEAAGAANVVLTPHDSRPGSAVRELAYLTGGVFNGGFVAVGQAARPFLTWLRTRVARNSIRDPEHGYVFGQRWLELVPALFEHRILREPGWNVMGWNLAGRELRRAPAGYEIDGRPLRVFHFCGRFDPHRPERLGTLPGLPWDEHAIHPLVRELCDEYARLLLAAGYDEAAALPYGWSALDDGTPVDDVMRAAYRHALIESEQRESEPPPGPFDADGGARFLEWLAAAADDSDPRLSRYLVALHDTRTDLRHVFPQVPGRDTARYLEWVREERLNELLIPPAFRLTTA
jgi:hypothetical protein